MFFFLEVLRYIIIYYWIKTKVKLISKLVTETKIEKITYKCVVSKRVMQYPLYIAINLYIISDNFNRNIGHYIFHFSLPPSSFPPYPEPCWPFGQFLQYFCNWSWWVSHWTGECAVLLLFQNKINILPINNGKKWPTNKNSGISTLINTSDTHLIQIISLFNLNSFELWYRFIGFIIQIFNHHTYITL